MPTTDLKSQYEAVLHDLEADRDQTQQQLAALQAKIRELNQSITTLTTRLNLDPSSRASVMTRPPSQLFANMSVRWAILNLLNDSEPMTTPAIAEALKTGGVESRAANFTNNVSAVLSTNMKELHKEVEQLPDGKWQLTETGKNAIAHIRSRYWRKMAAY